MTISDRFGLQNKTAIITGASRGIGQAIAEGFADAGAQVVLSSRKIDGLDQVAEGIRGSGGQAHAVSCHSGDPAQIDALVAATVERFGKVDILVNNAATNPYFGPLLDTQWPAWDKTFDVNVKGYFAASRAVAQHLIGRKAEGSIINVSSILGRMGGQFQGVYAMTKAAVISMTKTFALELGSEGIRVNAIAPGFIKTKFSQALVENPQVNEMIVNRTPLGRIGQPEDLVGLAIFLASDASKFVTGATYLADGGMTVG